MTDKLWAEALALPPAERIELAHALLESLHALGDAEAAWLGELSPRPQAEPAGTAHIVDWDEARERVAARSKARSTRPFPRGPSR